MSKPFQPSRADGRSDRMVVYELVKGAEPGVLFTYTELLSALSEGLESEPDRSRVHRAMAAVNKTLLREDKRYMAVVRDQGYRMIKAEEHLPVALTKKDQAQTYLKKGIELLRNARLEELTEVQRTLHEGQLMILAGVYQAVQTSNKRHDKQERTINEMRKQQEEINERLRALEAYNKLLVTQNEAKRRVLG